MKDNVSEVTGRPVLPDVSREGLENVRSLPVWCANLSTDCGLRVTEFRGCFRKQPNTLACEDYVFDGEPGMRTAGQMVGFYGRKEIMDPPVCRNAFLFGRLIPHVQIDLF